MGARKKAKKVKKKVAKKKVAKKAKPKKKTPKPEAVPSTVPAEGVEAPMGKEPEQLPLAPQNAGPEHFGDDEFDVEDEEFESDDEGYF